MVEFDARSIHLKLLWQGILLLLKHEVLQLHVARGRDFPRLLVACLLLLVLSGIGLLTGFGVYLNALKVELLNLHDLSRAVLLARCVASWPHLIDTDAVLLLVHIDHVAIVLVLHLVVLLIHHLLIIHLLVVLLIVISLVVAVSLTRLQELVRLRVQQAHTLALDHLVDVIVGQGLLIL